MSDLVERLNDPHRRLVVSDRQEAAAELARLSALWIAEVRENERLRALSLPEPTEGQVERVARAIYHTSCAEADDGECPIPSFDQSHSRLVYLDMARAALRAMPLPTRTAGDPFAGDAMPLQQRVWPQSRHVPEDWRPVPIESLQKLLALLPPPPLTQDGLTHRFEGPNPHDTIYAIRAAFIEMLDVKPGAMLAEERGEKS